MRLSRISSGEFCGSVTSGMGGDYHPRWISRWVRAPRFVFIYMKALIDCGFYSVQT